MHRKPAAKRGNEGDLHSQFRFPIREPAKRLVNVSNDQLNRYINKKKKDTYQSLQVILDCMQNVGILKVETNTFRLTFTIQKKIDA